jgi:fermentation-respiration switch protein FrsA (DUF1100 family)
MRREDVEFTSDALTLRGWLHLPDGPGPHPALVVANGYGSVKELFLDHPFPEVFCEAGFVVLVHDHPYCGDSDGVPRVELDPVAQQRGYVDAITFLTGRPEVDPDRIGIWGTSFSGGHVLAVGWMDRRVKCVVSMAMTISGYRNQQRRFTPDQMADLRRRWADDRMGRARGEEPTTLQQVPDTAPSAAYYAALPEHIRSKWPNRITLRSQELYGSYEPGDHIDRISPTPLLMIVALHDVTTFTDECLEAYGRAREPKRLVLVDGDHYSIYTNKFEQVSAAARDFFVEHLRTAS